MQYATFCVVQVDRTRLHLDVVVVRARRRLTALEAVIAKEQRFRTLWHAIEDKLPRIPDAERWW